jgi:hypothetical protein
MPGFLGIFADFTAQALAFTFRSMLLFQLQLFTFVLLFVQFLLRLIGVCVRCRDGIISCMCGRSKYWEASRTADNAIIVFS